MRSTSTRNAGLFFTRCHLGSSAGAMRAAAELQGSAGWWAGSALHTEVLGLPIKETLSGSDKTQKKLRLTQLTRVENHDAGRHSRRRTRRALLQALEERQLALPSPWGLLGSEAHPLWSQRVPSPSNANEAANSSITL